MPFTRRSGMRNTWTVTRVGRDGSKMAGKHSSFVTANFADAIRKGTEWKLAKDDAGNLLWSVTVHNNSSPHEAPGGDTL